MLERREQEGTPRGMPREDAERDAVLGRDVAHESCDWCRRGDGADDHVRVELPHPAGQHTAVRPAEDDHLGVCEAARLRLDVQRQEPHVVGERLLRGEKSQAPRRLAVAERLRLTPVAVLGKHQQCATHLGRGLPHQSCRIDVLIHDSLVARVKVNRPAWFVESGADIVALRGRGGSELPICVRWRRCHRSRPRTCV